MEGRLKKQIEFVLELDKIKKIGRQTYLSDASRKENDAEHSWHLAIMIMLLNEYSNDKLDVLKTMKMVLIHDVVEIDAGDTYAYDEEGNGSKRAREEAAADRIFNILPEEQAIEMRDLWEEFELGETAEAMFANAVDKIQPIMLNDASDGLAWREHGIFKSQVENRNENTKEGSEMLWSYCKELLDTNVQKKNLK